MVKSEKSPASTRPETMGVAAPANTNAQVVLQAASVALETEINHAITDVET